MIILEPGSRLPAARIAYALRPGAGERHLVAGQVVRTLATARESGIGAVVVTAPNDRAPVPMHWHEHEHDTWLCLQGAVQVWCDGQSRLLHPGDFAYVRPGGMHSYQSRRECTEFLGLVTPASWIDFFADAGEDWASDSYPASGTHPPDFPRLMAAISKYHIRQVPDAVFGPATEMPGDAAMPDDHRSYFLNARHGTRHLLGGHLSISLAGGPQTADAFSMRLIEASEGAAIPAHLHQRSDELIHLLSGQMDIACEGSLVSLIPGMTASIPSGTVHATKACASRTRWVQMHGSAQADLLFETLGTPTQEFMLPTTAGAMPDAAALRSLAARSDIIFEV